MAKEKIQITLDGDVLNGLDAYAAERYTTRSGVIQSALIEVLSRQKLIDAIKNLSLALVIAAEKGEIDPDTQRQLNEFQLLAGVLMK